MRHQCRLVTRVIGEQIFAATLDLGERLPPSLARARMVCIPVLISIARDMIDREMRGLGRGRGPSINAVAASLDVPFETARRNLHRMAKLGWVEIDEGITLPNPMPAPLAEWCVDVGNRFRAIADRIAELGAIDANVLGDHLCDNSTILAGLDLFLIMAGMSKHFDLRLAELLLIHFVCTASVVHLNDEPAGSAPFATAETVPDESERMFIPINALAQTFGVARSTIYRLVGDPALAGMLERRGKGVRGATTFLGSASYVEALQLVSGRTATLFSRIERHRCSMGCAALDHTLRRPRPWRQNPTLSSHAEIG